MSYAAKVTRHGVVIGEAEAESGRYEAKNFETGEIENLSGIAAESAQADPTDFWN